jgi:hypothetical protein
VKLTTHLHLVSRSKNAWSYTSTPPWRGAQVNKSTGTTLPFTFTMICNFLRCFLLSPSILLRHLFRYILKLCSFRRTRTAHARTHARTYKLLLLPQLRSHEGNVKPCKWLVSSLLVLKKRKSVAFVPLFKSSFNVLDHWSFYRLQSPVVKFIKVISKGN